MTVTSHTADISDTDLRALLSGAAKLGASPFDMLLVLNAESSFIPHAQNPEGCVGLNQFCPLTFKDAVPGVTASDYLAMPAAQQILRYIVPFWASKPRAAMSSARDIYWVNFQPATYRAGAPDTLNMGPSPDPSFDPQHKGFWTPGDLSAFLALRAQNTRFHELQSRLADLAGRGTLPSGVADTGAGLIAALALGGLALLTLGKPWAAS